MNRNREVLVLAAREQDDDVDPDIYDDEFDEDDEPAERAPRSDHPGGSFGSTLATDELCTIGVIAEIGHRISRPGITSHVILQGVARGVVREFYSREPFTLAAVERWSDPPDDSLEVKATMANILDQVETYVGMLPNVPEEVVTMVRSVDEPGWLADLIAFSPEFSPATRQELLEVLDPGERLRKITALLAERLEFMALRQHIQSEAQAGMDRQQREIMLREQLRAIQRELGELAPEDEMTESFREKIENAGMPEEVKAKAMFQLNRLEQQHPFSPEVGVIHSYLDWLTELPWAIETEDHIDLTEAARILDEDHYGLEKVKERLLEFIAVRKLAGNKMRSPII
jgi:ATP-dependent Lon protease